MAFETRNPFKALRVPQNLAGAFVQSQEMPLNGFLFLQRLDVTLEANFQFGLTGRHCRGDINSVVPNNGARMSKARNRRPPAHVFAGFNIPFTRGLEAFCDPIGMEATELRPVHVSCRQRGGGWDQHQRDGR